MLQEAKAAGWIPTGVETSEFAAKYAAQQSGSMVYAGTLQQNRLQAETFDVVTLMDVIEHVPEPQDLVAEIYRVLRPGGVLYIVTPNFGSFFVWLYGAEAFGVWPDHHVVYFEPSTLRRLLKKVGFQSVRVGSKDFYADNLKRFLRRNGNEKSVDLKSVFGRQGSLGRVRDSVNRILMHIPVGDKLIAFAQKGR
jgi:SAM-dependent methyltransferase